MFTATLSFTQPDSIILAIAGKMSEDALPEIASLIDDGGRDHEEAILNELPGLHTTLDCERSE